jgi:hypothetical protein
MSDTSIYNELVAGGLTPIAAAGVIGNLQQESGGNLTKPGGLIAQWGGARLTAESAYAKSVGLTPTSQKAEIGYLLDELHGGSGAAEDDSSVLSQINAASSPSEAALLFSIGYERSGKPDNPNREKYAEDFYKLVQQYKSLDGGSTVVPGGVAKKAGGVSGVIDGVGSDISSAFGLVSSAGSDISSVSGLIGELTEPRTWLRVAGVIVAIGLLMFGLVELAGGHPVADAGKAAVIGAVA